MDKAYLVPAIEALVAAGTPADCLRVLQEHGEQLRDERGDEGVGFTPDLLDFGKKKKDPPSGANDTASAGGKKGNKKTGAEDEIDAIVDAIEGKDGSSKGANGGTAEKGAPKKGGADIYDDDDRKDIDESEADDEGMPKREAAALEAKEAAQQALEGVSDQTDLKQAQLELAEAEARYRAAQKLKGK